MATLSVVNGDITTVSCEAIVNAANSALCGGGGVDGAIHRAAGPELLAACRKLGRCPAGSAVITPGFNLPAKFIIHAVGPVWDGGSKGEADTLASCYRKCICLALAENIQSVAFPAISCGVYKFPLDKAAKLAVNTVNEELVNNSSSMEVVFVCFEEKTERAISKELAKLNTEGPPKNRSTQSVRN